MPISFPTFTTALLFTQSQTKDFCKKDSHISSCHSMDPSTGCVSLWASTTEQIQPSYLSKNLVVKMANPSPCGNDMKQMGFQFQDQESSSTQSTGQSYDEVGSVGESNSYRPNINFPGSECNGTKGKREVGQLKSTSLTGTQECVLPPQVNYVQPYTCIPLSYADPYYSGLIATCFPQSMIQHPQMLGIGPARVPLPLDLPQNDPIYVNAKQYHAILRRRQYRAKLEAQNKLSKVRKPYLHESRHLHALKRVRGSGGRFLNTKTLQEPKPNATTNSNSTSAQLHLTTALSKSEVYHSKFFENAISTMSSSDITSASNSNNILQQQEFRFSLYPSSIGSVYGENQRYLAVHQ